MVTNILFTVSSVVLVVAKLLTEVYFYSSSETFS
jgi:hypothetical protein